MKNRKFKSLPFFLFPFIYSLSSYLNAEQLGKVHNKWGVIFVHNATEKLFEVNEGDNHDILPLMFFEKNNFYLHGFEAGYDFYKPNPTTSFRVLGKYKFFHLPIHLRDKRLDGLNVGLGVHKELYPFWDLYFDILSDFNARPSADFKSEWSLETWEFYWNFYVDFLFKSARYNNLYYGLNERKPGYDIDVKVGGDVSVDVYKNLYLVAGAGITYLGGKTIKDSDTLRASKHEYYFGGGLKNSTYYPSKLNTKYFFRYGFGFATPTNTNDILTKFKSEKDPYHNRLTSFFYGVPVSDDIFSIPISVYFMPGLAFHLKNKDRQNYFLEYVAQIKFVYTIPLPIRIHFGFGEGLSYASSISDIEAREMEERGLEPSKLLNYFEFSLKFSLHDIVQADILENMWLGWYLHHRSGIYGSSIAFNKVEGGSNYNMISLLYEF